MRKTVGSASRFVLPLRNNVSLGFFALLLLVLPACAEQAVKPDTHLPAGFVYADEVIPDLVVELLYFGDDNFVGARIDGYLAPKAILTRPAAEALLQVQQALREFGLGLKLFDAYRPQRAVEHFVRWASDIEDVKTKPEYYPDLDKKSLFEQGYIADRSSHSRGSTVDVTLVSILPETFGEELDMGTRFDFFGPESWPSYRDALPRQRAHRMLLQTVMTKYGFVPYREEWWHFTLRDEPFPDRYFDFPVQ
ncbi:MAG: M15 family metallopeptidase [Methylomicrobium sp.]